MYDLSELAAFSSVVRLRSLSASARELELPKSTLSRRIRQLEDKVGQPLLRRHGNRMLPTDAGAVFETYCREILSLSERSREALDELRGEVKGELMVHAHEVFLRGWLALEMERFMGQHPGLRVVLRSQVDPPAPDQDDLICIWLGRLAPEMRLRREVLGYMTRGLYAHPDYLAAHGTPQHPSDLARHAWVDLLGDDDRALSLYHPQAGVFPLTPPHSRLQVDRHVLQGDAIARGQGLGLLPHWVAEVRSRHHPGTLTCCLPEWQAPALPVSLLYPYGHLPRRARAFIEHTRSAVPMAWRMSGIASAEAGQPA